MKKFLKLLAAIAAIGGLAACSKDNPTPRYEVEAVDLGLGVKWASCNIGAKSETDFGSFFAWGETAPKSNYDYQNPGEYKWGTADDSAANYGMTKYNVTDELTILEKEDDAATAAWGDKWRMPTEEEFTALINDCNWTWIVTKDAKGNKVGGYIITSTVKGYEGNYIFLPAAGYYTGTEHLQPGTYGCYWSSSHYKYQEMQKLSLCIGFDSSVHQNYVGNRWEGRTVRAVTEQ